MEEDKPSVIWFIETQSQWFIQNGIPVWFHGIITRKEAEDLLQDKDPGCFLIRVGESRIGYSLSYRATDRYRHFMIDVLKDQQCKLSGDAKVHRTLDDLVKFHTQYPLYPYKELLTYPCGQKTTSAADYEELFENTQTCVAPIPNSVNTATGASEVPLELHHPSVLPRRLPADVINSQIINNSKNLPPVPPENTLYPSLPTQFQMSSNAVPVPPVPRRYMPKSKSVDFSFPNEADNANSQFKNGETQGVAKKPLKACRSAVTKAVSLVTEGEVAHDFKKMENAVVAHIKNVKENFGRLGHTVQKPKCSTGLNNNNKANIPDEYKKPPPFAPGFC